MKVLVKGLLGAVALAGFSLPAYADTTLTIATVNNGDMITMQKLTDDFTKANPDIKVNWVTLEENDLRQKVTKDIATKGGQYDILTIGTYETPIWGKKGWLVPLDKLDRLRRRRSAARRSAPAFRSTASSTPRRSTAKARSRCTARTCSRRRASRCPTRRPGSSSREAADKLTDRATGINGICLRGKAGWGENMAFLDADGELVRRALVRREVEAAVRYAGVEEDARPSTST